MDKNRARITIKLGQAKEPPKVEEVKADRSNSSSSEENLTDAPQGLMPFGNDREGVEEEHLDFVSAKSEIAVGEETNQKDQDEWFRSRYIPSKKRNYTSRLNYNRENSSKAVLGIIASITGAIAVGLMFGFIVLSFFKSGVIQEQTLSVINKPLLAGEKDQQEKTGGMAPVGTSVALPEETEFVSIQYTSPTYYVVQGGVFQDQASASPIMENIKSKGWPSSFWGENPAYLFLGIAANRDNALAIAAQFKDMDVYIKEMTEDSKMISIPVKKGASTSQEEWDLWFEQEETFIQTLGNSISLGLSNGKLEGAQMKEITESHRNLLQYGREIVSKLPESKQSLGNRMLNDFTKGVTAMEQYQKQPTLGYLWQAEQALLDAFQSKQQLFSSFK